MEILEITHDPYKRCEEHCNHDLARGVGVHELLSGDDGPHPAAHLIVSFTFVRALVLDEPTEAQQATG